MRLHDKRAAASRARMSATYRRHCDVATLRVPQRGFDDRLAAIEPACVAARDSGQAAADFSRHRGHSRGLRIWKLDDVAELRLADDQTEDHAVVRQPLLRDARDVEEVARDEG